MRSLPEDERKRRKSENSRKWREANRDKIKENRRRRHEANPEVERECKRKWRKANPEKNREEHRKYREANPDVIRLWRKANPEKCREHRRKWREGNPEYDRKWYEENLGYAAKWRKANPEKDNAIQARRRARKMGNGGSYTGNEWRSLCEAHGGTCLCCGVKGRMTADHVIPLAKNGRNDIGNLQPLCMPCNARKGVRSTDYRPMKQAGLL